ncbi:MAG: alpha/beta fold hydrolase [Polyangiales bacterium]
MRLRVRHRDHHLLEWNPSGATTVWLCHGYLDCAWAWQAVAASLALRYRVLALDWRGHGQSDWNPPGLPYHFVDYVADLWALWPQLATTRTHLVGHSMGGVAVVLFCGAALEGRSHALPALASVALLEGLGPPDGGQQDPRLTLRRYASRPAAGSDAGMVLPDLNAAMLRLQRNHPQVDAQWLHWLARKLSVPIAGGPERRWHFDPQHRHPSALPFSAERFCHFASAVHRPTLVLQGSRGMPLPDAAARIAALPYARLRCIEDAGHMLHWSHPLRVCAELRHFWQGLDAATQA